MVTALAPARLAFAADGTPYSEAYGDVYHSAEGGPAQARHVFLGGNGLPGRWQARARFVVLETGFGFGLNFLATWRAWLEDPRRCERLHFVSVEKHPFALADLRELHARYPEVEPQSAELHARWPMLVPGAHRLEFERGRVVLTLLFADAQALRGLRLGADAIYLDGFAPAKNPEMWTPALMRSIARLAAPGATAATWSVAGEVRRALEAAGFAAEKRAGFGDKKEMLEARYRGKGVEIAQPKQRAAAVVGAGLAGAAVCERLCARGWEVALYERRAGPAQEASGNHAGIFHPVLTPDDSLFARLTRAGFLASLAQWERLPGIRWDRCGVLQLARGEKEGNAQRTALAALAPPPEFARYVSREEASAHAGVPVAAPGLWFPEAGWIQPQTLVRAQLAACGERLRPDFSREIRSVEETGAAVVVLANSSQATKLHPVPHLRLRSVRGQITHVPQELIEPPHVAVLRGGLVLPPVDGTCVLGATYDLDDEDRSLRAEGHAANLERLAHILPGAAPGVEARALEGRVGFRSVAPDRLPVAGALAPGVYGAFAYGSRGLIWAALAAELIAAMIEGEPLPLEGALVDALDPARFARRAARRGRA
jgi:tRNA 5-methylaminomethyl-2-thiouridine biosynthesis bifunctional protein